MSLNDCIKIQENTIDIDGIETFIDFTRYSSFDQKFVEGLELAEDLNLKSGMTLYTKDTVIISKHVARLKELRESHPENEYFHQKTPISPTPSSSSHGHHLPSKCRCILNSEFPLQSKGNHINK